MTAHGYDPEPVHMDAAERLAYLGGYLPLNLLRLGKSLRTVSRQIRLQARVPPHRLMSVGDGAGPVGRPDNARV